MERKNQNKVYFQEIQSFGNSPVKWIFPLIFLVSVGPLAYGVYQQLVLGKPWGDEPSTDTGLVSVFVFVLLLMGGLWIAFSKSRLETRIDNEGIHYRFPVFVPRWRTVKKEQIVRYEVRRYSPLKEYGGWGYRHSPSLLRGKRSVAYNVSGKIGLQLWLAGGKKMLLGTQRPAAIGRAMKILMNENGPNDD